VVRRMNLDDLGPVGKAKLTETNVAAAITKYDVELWYGPFVDFVLQEQQRADRAVKADTQPIQDAAVEDVGSGPNP
jgi:hypothetical protein